MKHTNYLLATMMIAASLGFYACKKYPDGPAFSLHSKKHRIEGKWTVTSYKLDDGRDLITPTVRTYTYYACPCKATYSYMYSQKINMVMDIANESFTIESVLTTSSIDETATEKNCSLVMHTVINSGSDNGTWQWSSDKKQIIFAYNGSAPSETYDIIKLKEKEMKLKKVSSGTAKELTLTQ